MVQNLYWDDQETGTVGVLTKEDGDKAFVVLEFSNGIERRRLLLKPSVALSYAQAIAAAASGYLNQPSLREPKEAD